MSNKQWGHGFYTGREQGRKEASLFFLVASATLAIGKKGYDHFKEQYPERIDNFKKRINRS